MRRLAYPPIRARRGGRRSPGVVPDKEAALVILHALLGKEPYIPKLPKVYRSQGGGLPAAGGEIGQPVARPPSEPLPERLELRLRRQLQRLNSVREGQRHVR